MNRKHLEHQMALLQCKRDNQPTKQIEKELFDLKMRREFLKSPFMLKRSIGAIEKDKQKLEELKDADQFVHEWKKFKISRE